MQAVCVNEAGKLYLKPVPRPEVKDGQLLIKVTATALNRADLLQVNMMNTCVKVCVLDKLNSIDLLYVSCDRKEACTRLQPARVRSWVWRSVG